MTSVRLSCWLVAAVALGCAGPQKPPPRPVPPVDRSSIAAVLSHRGELQLTDEQVQKLQVMDDELERKNAAIRDELRAAREANRPAPGTGGGERGGGGERPGGMGGTGGMGMGGSGMGGMGGRGRGGMGGMGGGGRANREGGPGGQRMEAAAQKMDDNDTAAYLQAEAVLEEAQRARARVVASKYREELFDFREALRKRRDEP